MYTYIENQKFCYEYVNATGQFYDDYVELRRWNKEVWVCTETDLRCLEDVMCCVECISLICFPVTPYFLVQMRRLL